VTSHRLTLPPIARSRSPRRFLFVERGRWQFAVTASVIAAFALMPAYESESLWLGVGIALMLIIGWHSIAVGRRLPWIPGLALATAALQWVIAPWITYHIGPYFVAFDMVVPQSAYFGFAVPALGALAVGMLGVLRVPGRSAPPAAATADPSTRRFRLTCDVMVIVGIATQLFVAPMLGAGSLAFVVVLLGNIAFVGALALLLARAPGWPIRAVAVLGVQALVSADNGMFHDLVLWTSYFFLTIIYVYKLRFRTIALIALAGMAAIMVLNVVKRQFRETLVTTQAGLLGRAAILGNTMAQNASEAELAYEGSGFKANVTRLNQGWIIARVLYWVPVREPFANGETISAAVRATILPRVLDPGKLRLGGQTYFERFTGMALHGTSMDLSVAGEMYANYGYWGGLLGVFVFGLLIGAVYRAFLRLGERSRLWWAWAPFVLLYSTRAENSVGEVTNLVVKSAIVMVAVISLAPAWKMLRHPLRDSLTRRAGAGSSRIPAAASVGPKVLREDGGGLGAP
jgi:hypothetical protein